MNFLSKNEVNSVNGGVNACNQIFTCTYDVKDKALLNDSPVLQSVCPVTSDVDNVEKRKLKSKTSFDNSTLIIDYRIDICDK